MEPLNVRVAALAGTACGALGGILVVIAVAALPSPWTEGYVSEAGAPGAGHRTAYRIGIAGFAAGLILLGIAVRRARVLRVPPWVFLVSAGCFAAVSSGVPCTRGCPLPPYEASTARDIVHAGTSVVAVALATAAMLLLAATEHPRPVRLLSRCAAAFCLPVLCALAVALLAAGRGSLTAILERAGLAGVLLWAIIAGVLIGTSGWLRSREHTC